MIFQINITEDSNLFYWINSRKVMWTQFYFASKVKYGVTTALVFFTLRILQFAKSFYVSWCFLYWYQLSKIYTFFFNNNKYLNINNCRYVWCVVYLYYYLKLPSLLFYKYIFQFAKSFLNPNVFSTNLCCIYTPIYIFLYLAY